MVLNTALAGYGSGGRTYNAPILSSLTEFRVKTILTSSPTNVRAAKTDFPEAKVVQEYQKILEDPEIDLVVIVLPNHLHYSFAREALEAGKHVLLEKPITPSVSQAEELIALAEKNNVLLSVHHNRRWDSDFLTVQNVLHEGILGRIVNYEAHFDRFRPEVKKGWKEQKEHPGSGILYDLGSHLIDQALYLFGRPDEVFADIQLQRDQAQVPDYFELLLFYPGLKVTLKSGMLVKEKGPTFSIHGTRGSFVKFGADVQEEALKDGKKPADNPDWGIEPKSLWGRVSTSEGTKNFPSEKGDYRQLYRNVYQAIQGQAPLAVTPEQATEVIRIIELAQLSHAEKRVVKV